MEEKGLNLSIFVPKVTEYRITTIQFRLTRGQYYDDEKVVLELS